MYISTLVTCGPKSGLITVRQGSGHTTWYTFHRVSYTWYVSCQKEHPTTTLLARLHVWQNDNGRTNKSAVEN